MSDVPSQKDRRRFSWQLLLGIILLFIILLSTISILPQQFRYSLNAIPIIGDFDLVSEAQSVGGNQHMGSTQMTATAISRQGAGSPSATPLVKEAPLSISFKDGAQGGQTKKSYSGETIITVSGTGQADGTSYSDAFYVYINRQGKPIVPSRKPVFATLCINNQPSSTFIQSPPIYSATHIYTVAMKAPGGPLTFGICDTVISDNTGSLNITFP